MLSVRLDSSLEKQLNLIAQKHSVSKSKIIKESLIYYFDMLNHKEREKSPYEIGKDLFGRYSSGKTDLSTTYKRRVKDKIHAKNSCR